MESIVNATTFVTYVEFELQDERSLSRDEPSGVNT
jgi:hypothetical protein